MSKNIMFENITMGNAVTAFSGFMVLLSVILMSVFGYGFVWLPILVGILTVQSAFTGFCPSEILLRKYNIVK